MKPLFKGLVDRTNYTIDAYLKNERQLRNDDISSSLTLDLAQLEKEVIAENNDDNLLGLSLLLLMQRIVNNTYDYDIEQLKKILSKFISDDFPIEKYNIENIIRTLTNELHSRSVAKVDTYFRKIEKAMTLYFLGKITLGVLTKRIEQLNISMTKVAPHTLAMDIIGTLNSMIQRTLLPIVGFPYYTWNNMGDRLVRGNPMGVYPDKIPDHWIMGGILCRWDNDAVYSEDGGATWIPRTHKMEKEAPGVAWNCRCVGIPYVFPMLNSIDKTL